MVVLIGKLGCRSGLKDDEIWFLYETWDNYMKRLHSAVVKDGSLIYDSINGNSYPLKTTTYYKVKEVEGEWAKVYCANNEKEQGGWIKWTDGVKLLIRPVTALYY